MGEECTVLDYQSDNWMNDSPISHKDHAPFVDKARGTVVLTGLGIGYLPMWLVMAGQVDRIIILEKDERVRQLVWPHFEKWLIEKGWHNRVLLIMADANQYVPELQIDFLWVDHFQCPATASEREAMRALWSGKLDTEITFWDFL